MYKRQERISWSGSCFGKELRNGCKCAERQINGTGVIPDIHKFWRSAREVISMEEINERHCGYLICIDTDGRPLIRFLKSTQPITQRNCTHGREKKKLVAQIENSTTELNPEYVEA
ncbi:hypothetical protein TNIN_334301 [Trichonephila inaurata madagascariensis]|uniref:Uncharacterized protein n=1 Tax=Trichonephila inaurata madagascariensis TaxID=2747483 RepID=A0A8X6XRG9_9ARAC|nr:hypothetical protein TNIN_334301 [Trichonephila inaurata madagascariensis]